jgi:hypothetical protein
MARQPPTSTPRCRSGTYCPGPRLCTPASWRRHCWSRVRMTSARVHRGHLLRALGLDVLRLGEWWLGSAPANTRSTPFARLMAEAAASPDETSPAVSKVTMTRHPLRRWGITPAHPSPSVWFAVPEVPGARGTDNATSAPSHLCLSIPDSYGHPEAASLHLRRVRTLRCTSAVIATALLSVWRAPHVRRQQSARTPIVCRGGLGKPHD